MNKNINTTIYYQFNLMSHDYRALEAAVSLYKKSFKTQNLKLQGPIFLPKKEKNIVLLRSPHVNKASREVFKFKQYKIELYAQINTNTFFAKKIRNVLDTKNTSGRADLNEEINNDFSDLDSFLKRMCLLDIAGVSVQIKKKL